MTLRIGSIGPEVAILQDALRAHGFNPGAIDGSFGAGTQAALIAFQNSEGLLPDGVVGPRTATALGLAPPATMPSIIAGVTVQIVSQMFPQTPLQNIKRHLPIVLNALVAPELTEKPMVLMLREAVSGMCEPDAA